MMVMAEEFRLPVIYAEPTPRGPFSASDREERDTSRKRSRSTCGKWRCSPTPARRFPVVIGVEGGFGGALGIGVTDRILMLENSYYSVITPEGCAAILWKDGAAAPLAAVALKVDADDLEKLGTVDEVIAEPLWGERTTHPACAAAALEVLPAASVRTTCARAEIRRLLDSPLRAIPPDRRLRGRRESAVA